MISKARNLKPGTTITSTNPGSALHFAPHSTIVALLAVIVGCSSEGSEQDVATHVQQQSPFEELEEHGSDEVVHQGNEEAVEHDLGLMAESKGWTIEQARSRNHATQAVRRIATELIESHPGVLVGAEIGPESDAQPSLYVKGDASPLVRELVRKENVPIRIIDKQPYSFEELVQREIIAAKALQAAGYDNFSVTSDMRQLGRVSATVRSASGASAETRRVSDILVQAVRGDAYVEVTTETVAVPHSQSIGGTRMTIAGGTNWCTSGWTVLHNILGSGVTSAGHCTDQKGIRHHLDNGVIHPAFEVSRHHSTYGDVGWYTTDAAEPGIFYATATVTRNTMSIDSVFIAGETLCMYSRVQNSPNCSAVVDNPSVSINYGGSIGIVSQLVHMSAAVAIGGDSGAGWFFSNRASGGQSGNAVVAGVNGSVFSKASLFPSAIGARVRRYNE